MTSRATGTTSGTESANLAASDADGLSAPPPPEQLPEGTPQRIVDAVASVTDELNEVSNQLNRLIDEQLTAVAGPLAGMTSAVASVADELIGAVDIELTGLNEKLAKIVQKLFGDAAKHLQGSISELRAAGFDPPYLTSDIQSQLEGDWLTLLVLGAPPFQPYFPEVQRLPPIREPQYPIPGSSFDPDAGFSPGTGETPFPPEGGYTPIPPTSPGWSPSPPTSPPTSSGEGGEVVCCPAPVNVTVNVPPIAVRLPDGYAPPDVYVDVDPTINVSSPGVPPVPPVPPVYPPPPTSPPGSPPPPPTSPPAPGPRQPISSLLFPLPNDGLGRDLTGSLNWGVIDSCAKVSSAAEKLKPTVASGTVKSTADGLRSYIDVNYGPALPEGMGTFEKTFGFDVGKTLRYATSFGEVYAQSMLSAADHASATAMIPTNPIGGIPNPTVALITGAKLSAVNTAERRTGMPLSYLFQSDTYLMQWANPQFLPNQIRIDSAFLMGEISEGTWECWTKAIGNLPEPSRRVLAADQLKPNLMDTLALWRRGKISHEELEKRARALGVLHPGYLNDWKWVTTALPTQSDLIRFMTRDAADETVAKLYRLDEGFTDKYTGPMKDWARALGLDEQYFRFQWRSHWDVPSYTQLTEMLARLRPDRLEVEQWKEGKNFAGEHVGEEKRGPKPLEVTKDDVRRALQINDMSPGWIEQLIAISYNPINRTDAIRAYMMGAFDDDQLRDAFLNVRYSPRDADIMLAFYRRDKARRNRNVTGTWSSRKVIRFYKERLITREVAEGLLAPLMPTAALMRETLEAVDIEQAAENRRLAMRALKKRFTLGELNGRETAQVMREWGMDFQQADDTVENWTIERDGRLKQPTVAQIGKWLKYGIIPMEEARHRLTNLGYSQLDADRIIAAALKWEWDEAAPSAEELGDAISEVIANQKEAKNKSAGTLSRRLKQIWAEAIRIKKEIDRRRDADGEPPTEPMVIP